MIILHLYNPTNIEQLRFYLIDIRIVDFGGRAQFCGGVVLAESYALFGEIVDVVYVFYRQIFGILNQLLTSFI